MRWIALVLMLASSPLFAAQPPSMQQLCLDQEREFCAWEANPEGEQSVVLVHGLNGSATEDWHQQIELLADSYHVLAIELPGFDRESDDASRYSVDYFSEVIRRFTDRYIGGPYYLVGHSMGGAIALRHALFYPDQIRRLVLVDVAGVLHRISYSREIVGHWARGSTGEHSGLSGFLEKMTMKLLAGGENLPGTDESANEVMLNYTKNPQALASMQLVRQDFSGRLLGMNVPTLILWGEDDTVAPLRTAYALNARLPNARLHILSGAGHIPMREQPERFNWQLLAFLQADGAMPGDEQRYRIPRGENTSERVAGCSDENGGVFEGDYARLELRGCERVVIRNARIRELRIYNSRVSLLNSAIGGAGVERPLVAEGADVKVTASHIRGTTAMQLSGSRFDLAGATLCAAGIVVEATGGSDVAFSISEMRTPERREFLHGFYELDYNHSLPEIRQQ